MKFGVKGSCFFCMKRKGVKAISLRGKDWPEPIPKEMKLLMCTSCSVHLTAEEMAADICHYAYCLRIAEAKKRQLESN